jgi:hypothetical protein
MNYFSHPYVSNSDLSKLKGDDGREPFEAYRIGTLVDAFITEPEKVDHIRLRIIDRPEYKYSTADFRLATSMRASFVADSFCRQLLRTCTGQREMYVEGVGFSYDGIDFTLNTRVKYDLWSDALGWGADIKSTTATTHAQFLSAVEHFDYDRQRYFYMNTSGARKDVLIGISKVNYKVFILQISDTGLWYSHGQAKTNALAFQYYKNSLAW